MSTVIRVKLKNGKYAYEEEVVTVMDSLDKLLENTSGVETIINLYQQITGSHSSNIKLMEDEVNNLMKFNLFDENGELKISTKNILLSSCSFDEKIGLFSTDSPIDNKSKFNSKICSVAESGKRLTIEAGYKFSTNCGQLIGKELIYLKAQSAIIKDANFTSPKIYLNFEEVECEDSVIKADTIYLPIDSDFSFEDCSLIGNVKYLDFDEFEVGEL